MVWTKKCYSIAIAIALALFPLQSHAWLKAVSNSSSGGGGGTPSGPAGGDLSGTYPNPSVAKVNGASVPASKTIVGTNSSGQVIDATGSTLSNNTTGTAANVTATSNSTITTLPSLSLPGSQVSGNIPGNSAGFTGNLGGDVTGAQGSTTVGKINGGSVPASAAVLGTNSSSQPVAATSSGIIGLFTGCSGTQYLGADGACHSSSGSGTVNSGTAGQVATYLSSGAAVSGVTQSALYNTITPVTKRAPTVNDDTTKGFAVGSLWNYNGLTWANISNTSGFANWQLQTVSPNNRYMCDVVSGAQACYGVFKMVAAYSGNAFQITRASDSTTKNIGFLSNSYADFNTADNFCAGTSCTVTTWYDQSGHAYDLTAGTFAPFITYGNQVNGIRSISFDNYAGNIQALTNTSLPITSIRAMSVGILGQLQNASFPSPYLVMGSPTAAFTLQVSSGSGIFGSSTRANRFDPSFTMMVSSVASGGKPTYYQNNYSVQLGAGLTNTAATGISVGGNSSNTGYWDALAVVVYNSTLSSANIQTLQQSAYSWANIQPQVNDVLAWLGSSLLSSQVEPANDTVPTQQIFPYMLASGLNHPFQMYNLAYPGTCSGPTGSSSCAGGQQAGIATANAPYIYNAGAQNIVIIDGPSNDISSTSAPNLTAIENQEVTNCQTFNNQGFTCVMGTIISRCGIFLGGQTQSGFNTAQSTYNTWLRANYNNTSVFPVGTQLADPASDSILGNYLNFCNGYPTIYTYDGVHGNYLSYSMFTSYYLNGLLKVIQ